MGLLLLVKHLNLVVLLTKVAADSLYWYTQTCVVTLSVPVERPRTLETEV